MDTAAAGGSAACGLVWLGMTVADILNWPVATSILPSGPNAGAATVLFTGGSDRMYGHDVRQLLVGHGLEFF